MTRFVVSLLAGALIMAGGWYGWQNGDRVDDRVADAASSVGGPGRSGMEVDPSALGAGASGERTGGSDSTASGDKQGSNGTGSPTSSGSRSSRTSPSGPMPTDGTDPGAACASDAPTTANGMNEVFAKLDSEPTLEGADHGASVALADGRRMFVFGDTIRADTIKPFMVKNSVLIVDQGCVNPMAVEGDGPAIPSRGGRGFWPMSMRAVPTSGGTVVQVITVEVHFVARGEFVTEGSGLATFEVPTGRSPRLISHTKLTSAPDATHPTWGAAMWESGGQIYLYGTATDQAKSTAGWSLRVARTAPGNLSDPSAWEFWNGSTWVRGDPEAARGDAAALVPAENGVSHVLSVFERGGSWYALSKEGDYLGETLAVWKAPSPTGPFTKHRMSSLANDSKIRRYTPLAHTDFATSSGALLISWSESPQTSPPYFTNPELYRPRFGELWLP